MNSNETCAACGKIDNLKTCTGCRMIKYCSVACQKKHRPSHKKTCRNHAAATSKKFAVECNKFPVLMSDDDNALFRDPPPKEDCPICFLPIPICSHEMEVDVTYFPCCGKTICGGCIISCINSTPDPLKLRCAFCRSPLAKNEGDSFRQCEKRMELNDAEAFYTMGERYFKGTSETKKDHEKAFQFYKRASELGSPKGHYALADCYCFGHGTPTDTPKSRYYDKLAVMAGHEVARFNYGNYEKNLVELHNQGNMRTAMMHFMISAKQGLGKSLKEVMEGYKAGHVTKEEYENTLRTYKNARDEMSSETRAIANKCPAKLLTV